MIFDLFFCSRKKFMMDGRRECLLDIGQMIPCQQIGNLGLMKWSSRRLSGVELIINNCF
jgi:hypothetical protein